MISIPACRRWRLILAALLLITSVMPAWAQTRLSSSPQQSLYTYAYRITPKEAALLTRKGIAKMGNRYLRTPADSFFTDKPVPALPAGNYLLVKAVRNELRYQLYNSGDVNVKLLHNSKNQQVVLHTRQGVLVTDATVYQGKRRLSYDAVSRSYGPLRPTKSNQVQVYYKQAYYAVPLKREGPKTSLFKRLKRRLFGQKDTPRYHRSFFYEPTVYEEKFKGFLVFSKPKYKPGDTVRLKAFVETASGKLVNRPLLLRLSNHYLDTDTILATLQPYRPGGYLYEFVLSDTLDLDLDEDYLVTLEELRSKKYDPGAYNGDMDEDDYVRQRQVLVRNKFTYEDYELKSIQFTARSDKDTHLRGQSPAIFLKATDENGLPVMDGRVQLLVTHSHYSTPSFNVLHAFVPDTLWNYTRALETVGETRINIPDTVFPAASFGYDVRCTFLNSDNEEETANLYLHHEEAGSELLLTPKGDSLLIEQHTIGKSITGHGTLYVLGKPRMLSKPRDSDTLARYAITLPATVKIHPLATSYLVTTDSLEKTYTIRKPGEQVYCQGSRTADSISLQLVNPSHLPVWYTLFAGNQLLLSGYGDTLFYQARTYTPDNYSVTLQYLYGGEIQENTFYIPYKDKLLTIQTDQPAVIYPGQTTRINLQVTDQTGAAVPDADVTAYAVTSKFKAAAPYIPYTGKYYGARKAYPITQVQPPGTLTYASALNWEKWSREMRLDTVDYYQFTHPQPFCYKEEPGNHITQVAPFLMSKGNLLPIYLLYIDEKPVFFSQAQQLKNYSFPVTGGVHRITFRTRNKQIRVDGVRITANKKNFISINADAADTLIQVQDMPETLTPYETTLWSKYMLLMADNFGSHTAHIRQGETIYQLNEPEHTGKRQTYDQQSYILTGPLADAGAALVVKQQFKQFFLPAGNWQYRISEGFIERRQPRDMQLFPSALPPAAPEYDFQDLVLTEDQINERWQDFLDERNHSRNVLANPELSAGPNGRLIIGPIRFHSTAEPFITQLLLFRYDNPDFMRAYPGVTTDLGPLPAGKYRLLYLFKGNAHYVQDSINIIPNGTNYYSADTVWPYPPIRFGDEIAGVIDSQPLGLDYSLLEETLDRIKEFFHKRYLDTTSFTGTVEGNVFDDHRKPLPGVRVTLKGTQNGTYTDAQGQFCIQVPGPCPLLFTKERYAPEIRMANPGKKSRVMLMRESYWQPGTQTKTETPGSKNTVSYSVAAMMTNQLSGKVAGLIIRGINTSGAPSAPLIIVDGIPYSGRLEDLDPALLASMNVLKPDAAAAIYGAAAAGGAILVTTKKNSLPAANTDNETTAPIAGNVLRRRFRDDAYWQPALRTDANGRASFDVTFPDDITSWQSIFIAMTDKQQSGSLEASVKAFKQLSANIALPQFAIAGDSINVIGKTLYYAPDSARITRAFSVDDKLVQENNLLVRNAIIDTFGVKASHHDSLKVKYTIQKAGGYFDGEERSIPIYRPGLLAANGYFAALNKDTSFRLSLAGDTSPIHLYAESSLLPVLYQETESIRKYEYLCNEQLASKLKAMIAQQRIAKYLHQPFKGEKHIRELLNKLEQGHNSTGLWGWWADNTPAMWISLHVMEAKAAAVTEGYKTSTPPGALTGYLVYNLDSYNTTERISALFLLQQLGAKPDFKTQIDTLEKRKLTSYERLRLAELKQLTGLPLQLNALVAQQQRSLMGNIYWGNEGYAFFDNAIQSTLCMYRILKKAGGYQDLLPRIRNYFLESRRSGEWRNTYESSLILETILPDLLSADPELKPATLTIKGDTSFTTTSYPFAATLRGGTAVTIHKQGPMPVYFTAYQRYWDTTAAKTSGNFTVQTSFNGDSTAAVLKAGKPVALQVTINVKETAEYVMVEIPIPAGCSYENKNAGYQFGEVHREYFKHKVSIFCNQLHKGKYTFTVNLLPRYTGMYTLNPAKAEMMYFPVFNGHEGIRKVKIE